MAILNEVILNIISLHSYDEVKLVLITSPKQVYNFDDFKNVPHIWSNDKKVRFFATNPDEVHYIFNIIDEMIKEREESQDRGGTPKSEFLQAFILSLAINYSPKEVAFVLVDFKGGDMARPFMAKPFAPALPHLSATISNLSGNILYRALVSLEAEIKSRQRIFNEAAAALGVDKLDINSYHKYYKGGRLDTPLPHLVIIIDEFAQLKTQQPEFLAQLINVAQVGRSLGIHLILATQKPSGIVDPQIMSNSRFRVCLKVADKQDSIDMINKPDSAMIKNPGRLYLQVGYDEIYECIQSGYSGANYYSPTPRSTPPESIFDESGNLILGTSKSAALMYGITLSEDYKVCICANDTDSLGKFYGTILMNIAQYSNRRLVFIDDDNGTFRNIVDECSSCQYISGATALDEFIEELKPELNARLEEPGRHHEQLFIVISEFNDFFDMITNEQAAFMRKVFQYIDAPQYGIYFICGFNVNGAKNNDRLFMSLVVNAENYILCPNCYENASAKIETLPLVPDVKSHSCYFCLKEKNVEIRW